MRRGSWWCKARILEHTLIPLRIYFVGSRLKMEIGLCRGKKLYDKRDSEAKKEAGREIERRVRDQSKYD